MTSETCMHEDALLEALETGRWPEACDHELRDHVARCSECSDLALVADAFIEDRRSSRTAAVPPSGAVWWRMQLRLDRETRETAAKTVRRAHGAVIGATVMLLIAAAAMTSILRSAWTWLTSIVPDAGELLRLSESFPLVAVGLVAVLLVVLAPIAVYLAVAE